MKQSFEPLMLFEVINEACSGVGGAAEPLTVGGKKQCLEGAVKSYALAREDFSFATVEAAKTKAGWDTAIASKDIVPFPYVEAIEANNTEAVIREGRFQQYPLKKAVRGSNYRQDLAITTHEAVKSYENSAYTRIFRLTVNNEITCETLDSGEVKGEKITSFIVGIRQEATDADNPFTNIQLKYASDAFSILKAPFEVNDLEGVQEMGLRQMSATNETITFSTRRTLAVDLNPEDVIVKGADGEVKNVSFVSPDEEGVYQVSGDFKTGDTVQVQGVKPQVDVAYENRTPLTVNIKDEKDI